MEIHAPEKPILTIKEAIVHLGIVTAGILIALSLEAVVEYAHHRTVVREAREIMKSEIEDNLKDLNETMDRIMLQQDGLRKGIRTFSAMAKGEKVDIERQPFLRTMLLYRTADLHTAGHATAELMGAFGYMDYREVRQYATIYDFQDRFLREQSSAFAEGLKAFAWRQERDVPAAPPADLAVFVERLRETLAAMTAAGQFGGTLEREYTQFLLSTRIRKPGPIDGDWTGSLAGGRVPVVLHIVTFQDGMMATLDIPNQNAVGVPVSSVALDGAQFKFELNLNPTRFAGALDESKSTITGTWTNGESAQPLVLTKQKATK